MTKMKTNKKNQWKQWQNIGKTMTMRVTDLTLQLLKLVPCALELGLNILSASNIISISITVISIIIIIINNIIIIIIMEKSYLRSSDSAKWSEALWSLDEILSNLQNCKDLWQSLFEESFSKMFELFSFKSVFVQKCFQICNILNKWNGNNIFMHPSLIPQKMSS